MLKRYRTTTPFRLFDNDPPEPPAAPTFDVNNLPPEFQAHVDRERTQASSTARINALKDAVKDEKVVATVRAQLEKEANLSADEKHLAKERELAEIEAGLGVQRNQITAEGKLVAQGLDRETAEKLAGLLATADPATTDTNIEAFTASFTAAVDAQVKTIKAKLLANGGAPDGGGNDKTTEAEFRAQHQAALDAGKGPEAIAIQRKAKAAGIIL